MIVIVTKEMVQNEFGEIEEVSGEENRGGDYSTNIQHYTLKKVRCYKSSLAVKMLQTKNIKVLTLNGKFTSDRSTPRS